LSADTIRFSLRLRRQIQRGHSLPMRGRWVAHVRQVAVIGLGIVRKKTQEARL
jgi:hypothetical protein